MRHLAFFQKISPRHLLLAVSLSLGLSLFAYLFFFQSALLAKREYVFSLLVWIALTPLVYLLLMRFLIPTLNEYTLRARRNWVLLSATAGILFAIVSLPSQLLLLLPKHTLQIEVPAGDSARSITLEYATTSLGGDISYTQFSTSGSWKRVGPNLFFTGSEPASLSWSGRTGESITLVFTDSPTLKEVQLRVDGKLIPLDSINAVKGQVTVSDSFPASCQAALAGRMISGFTAGLIFLVFTLFLAGMELKTNIPVSHKKGYWLLYTIPMIAVWGIFFFTYFPGMMSNDSYNQWQQAATGVFNDIHPVFHTLLIWLLSRIWFSPAIVALFQILTLSITTAWGISILDGNGLPKWAAWTIASIFALSPLNADLVNVLWKDIPYSTALFLFSLMILNIVFTRGEWLNKTIHWLFLALVSLFVAGFRKNGVLLPFLSIPVLIIFYKGWWKQLLGVLFTFTGMYLIYQGPVFQILQVNHSSGSIEQILVHHIAAHIVNGTPLTPEQEKIANQIIPSGIWQYSCCLNVNTMDSPGYSDEKNAENSSSIRKLFLELLIAEPGVELQHQVCVSSLVWQIPNHCPVRNFYPRTTVYWISPRGGPIQQNSQLPFLVEPLTNFLFLFRDRSGFSLVITPSLYLYLGLFCTFFTVFRKNFLMLGLYLLPAGLQSFFLILVNISSAFRYQYGVMLVGMFSLGLLILALHTPRNLQPGLISSTTFEG